MPKSKFGWAANPYKLEKAIENVGDKDEEKTKAEYQRLGGLVRNTLVREFVAPKPRYPWAANKSKLDRAILKATQVLNTDGKPPVDEESIKAQYISLGGLVLNNEDTTVAPKAKKTKSADEDTDS
jgi:hypothetical protein